MVDYGRGHMKKNTKSKRAYAKPKSNNNSKLVKLIKSITVKESESKYKTITKSLGSMTNNDIYRANLWGPLTDGFPGQNSTDSGRIGDRIVCQGIMIRAIFDVPWDRKNVKLKCFFIPYNSDQGSPNTYANLFHNITGIARLDPIQKKRYPGIKYLGTYQIEPERASYYTYGAGTQVPDSDEISANTGTICVKKWIPMYNKKVFFRSDATNQPSNLKEIGAFVAVPYATMNTAVDGAILDGDTVILSSKLTSTIYYKDI